MFDCHGKTTCRPSQTNRVWLLVWPINKCEYQIQGLPIITSILYRSFLSYNNSSLKTFASTEPLNASNKNLLVTILIAMEI